MQLRQEDFPVFERAMQSPRTARADTLRATFAEAVAGDDTRKFHFVMQMQYLAQGLLPRHYGLKIDEATKVATLKSCFDFYTAYAQQPPSSADQFMVNVLLAGLYRKGEGCTADPDKSAAHRMLAFPQKGL